MRKVVCVLQMEKCVSVCPGSYWFKSECVYEHCLQEGERRGTAAASDSCVINIRTSEGGRESGREREREGGAVLLRNAKPYISSIVKNHRDADRFCERGEREKKEREVERCLAAGGAWCVPAFL